MTTAEIKSELRKSVREKLRHLTGGEIAQKSVEICTRIRLLPEWKTAGVICIFAPIQGEPNLELLDPEGRKVCYPRVNGDALDLYYVADPQAMEISGWGIRQPRSEVHPLTDPAAIDLIFVPGLAFSNQRERLGRGAGFYDRLFAQPGWRAKKIGVGFDCQRVAELPCEAHDHPLDAVITETGFWG